MIASVIAAIVGGFTILGFVLGFVLWLFRMATDVAVLKAQMGEVQPVQIAKDIAWIKGALNTLARVLHADLDEESQ